jgi:hypothetical protein
MLLILRAVCPELLVRVYLIKGVRQFSSATLYAVCISKYHIQITDICIQESHDIHTRCEDLIQPAQQVSNACHMGNRYTYSYVSRNVVDGSETYPYLVAIGDDYAFMP